MVRIGTAVDIAHCNFPTDQTWHQVLRLSLCWTEWLSVPPVLEHWQGVRKCTKMGVQSNMRIPSGPWWLSVKPEEHCFRAKGPNWLALPSYLCSPSLHHAESGPKGQTFGLEHEISMGKRGHKTSHAASYSQSLSRKPRDFLPLTTPKPEKTLARAAAACLASV